MCIRDRDNVGVAYNVMAKFDDAFFEPVTAKEMEESGIEPGDSFGYAEFPYAAHTWSDWPYYTAVLGYKDDSAYKAMGPKMLYGTTKDKKGWDHNGLKPDQEGDVYKRQVRKGPIEAS